MTSTLHFRRNHPGGGPKGRCSYGVTGLSGLVVFDMALFPGKAPATITLDCPLAEPKAKAEPKAAPAAMCLPSCL